MNRMNDALGQHSLVCLFGPGGIGKTVAAAQFSEQFGATFLRVSGLTPKDIFAVIADALKSAGSSVSNYATLAGARLGLSAAWAERQSVT